LKKQKSTFPAGRVKKAWAKIERSCGEANLTLHKNFLNSPDCQMAENLDPPRIAGRHFFVDIKTVHFGRNGTSIYVPLKQLPMTFAKTKVGQNPFIIFE